MAHKTSPSRRSFLKVTAATGAAVTAFSSLPGRAFAEEEKAPKKKKAKTFKAEAVEDKVTIVLADHESLATEFGGLKVKVKGRKKFMLHVTRLEGDKYLSISGICTHESCKTKWEAEKKRFGCPCHHSAFDLDGNPASTDGKPSKATVPLAIYPNELKDGELTITLPKPTPKIKTAP